MITDSSKTRTHCRRVTLNDIFDDLPEPRGSKSSLSPVSEYSVAAF